MIYFTDRALNIIGQASYDLPEGLIIADDRKTEDVDTGVVTFECKIPFTSATRNLVETCTACGNYILRDGEDDSEFYTIIDSETDTKKREVYLYAEDAGLDLLNEITGAYAATEAHPIAWYIERFTGDTGFEIGFNEAADLSRTLSWDGESTITERLASVAIQFGCELSYSFAVEGLQLTHKYINIYRERGNDAGVSLRLNYEIDNIITSSSIANLATALHPTGGTPEGAEMPITLVGYSYDDGDIYLENGYLKSREAVKKWSRYLNPTEPDQNYTGHILRTYSYETTDQSVLCAHAITELKKVREVEINYEVDITDLPENVRIGDRVNVIDDASELYVSSRILKLETSIANQKRTATLGEYLIKGSGINQKVIDLASAFAAKAQETAKAFAAAQAAQVAASTAQASANTAASAASTAQSTANNAVSAASTAQNTANNVQTNLATNYTDTEGMTDAINLKFGQITLTVEAGTGADAGKLFVKVNDGGSGKQGTIDLTGLVKITDLATAGSTVINGANITTGTVSAINIDGCEIDGGIFAQSSQDSTQEYLDSLEVQYGKIYWYRAPISNPSNRTLIGRLGMVDEEGNYYIDFHTENNIPLRLGGNIVAASAIQFGTTSLGNVYAKFIANSSGDYYGLHASSGMFYLHKQNSAGTVTGNYYQVDSSGNVKVNQGTNSIYGWTEVLSKDVGIRVNYNAGNPAVSPISGSAAANNTVDFGTSGNRFKTLYLVNAPNVSSDARLKKDITPADNDQALAFLKALEVVSYSYTFDKEGNKKRIGVIAQNMLDADADFAPYFVDDDGSEDKILSLRSSDLVFPLIQTVQQQQKQIEDLTARIVALERR